MNDTPLRPATTNPAEAATEPPADRPTLPSDHPHAPHPAAIDGIPQLIGDYAILRKLGEGGMGTVYLAEDTRLGRKVAIKTIRPELAANPIDRGRFEREARTAAMVEHDHIVPILHVGEAADGTPFIVMPFLQGETLDARLKRDGALPLDLLLKVARETAEGLAAAHAKGLIHRDIKPANIWLEGDLTAGDPAQQVRRCKILDFGLARPLEGGDAQLTGSGAVIGTPAYMSPEQARGAAVDHRADLFSLGATLYRAASGKLPFEGPTPMAVLIALSTEAPKPVLTLAPGLPPAVADFIGRLMQKNPAQRPESAAEVAKDARKIEAQTQALRAVPAVSARVVTVSVPAEISPSEPLLLPTSLDLPTALDADPPEPRRPSAQPPRRFPWPLVAAGLLLLVLGALGVWFAVKDRQRQQDLDAAKEEPKDGPRSAEPPKKDAPAGYPADRAAARLVLSVGGMLCANGDEQNDITDVKHLPKEPFRLTSVRINSKSLTDDALAVFKDCKHIQRLDLGDNPWLTDAGLAHFHPNPEWKKLDLGNTSVSDKSAAWIKRCTRLADLELRRTQVSQKGIDELRKALPNCIIQWDGGRIDPWAGERPGPAPMTDSKADRKAAEFVLSIEGKVWVNEEERDIRDVKELPKGQFRLTAVSLGSNHRLTDKGLEVFKECKNITILELYGTDVSNDGLANFQGCKNLEVIYLSHTKVTDAGLVHFKGLKKLTAISFTGTKIGDDGLANFKDCPNLASIEIGETPTGDKGLSYFKDHPNLLVLDLAGTQVGDPGVAHIKNFKKLKTLSLQNTKVTDKGLANFKGLSTLYTLDLSRTDTTDVGLANFQNNADLASLGLSRTKVTDDGLAIFSRCKALNRLHLSETAVGDKGLAHFGNCEDLWELMLADTKVTGASLEVLKQFRKLTVLDLRRTALAEKDVRELAKGIPKCKIQFEGGTVEPASEDDRKAAEFVLAAKGSVFVDTVGEEVKAKDALPKEPFRLTTVYLITPVKDADLAVFKDCRNITNLYLVGTGITSAGFAHFAGNKNLTSLNLSGTKVDDSAVPIIKTFKKLEDLSVGVTELSEKGVKEIADALPGCRIQHDGGTIEPKKK